MAVNLKDMVRIKVLTPALMAMLTALVILDAEMDGDITVTSINDSRHMVGSQHYRNTAVDIRTNDRPASMDAMMAARLRQILGPAYTVLYESPGTPNEHIHIQIKKGTRVD